LAAIEDARREASPFHRRLRLGFAVAATFLGLAATPAVAATPIDLGAASESPRLAVDPAGTGFLTWADGSQAVHYCRLPQGAAACATTRTFTYAAGLLVDEGSYPVVADSRVIIANDRYGPSAGADDGVTGVYTSTDGGQTFTPPSPPGVTVGTDSSGIEGSVLFSPANGLGPSTPEALLTIGGGTKSGGAIFQATSTSGPPTASSFSISGGTATNSSSLAQVGTTLLAAYTDVGSPNSAFSRQYMGGPPNLPANWSAPQFITDVGSSTSQLVGGPGGIYFVYTTTADRVAIRKLAGGVWGAPLDVTPVLSGSSGRFAATEDPSGIVHVAYVEDDALKYRYGRSTANDQFTNPQTLVPSGSSSFSDPRMAADGAGKGYVSWVDGGTFARAVPFAPGEPPAPEYTGPTKEVKEPLGGGDDLVLTVPKKCVDAGSSFKVSVKLKSKKKKGSKKRKKTKITRVDFSADGTLVATDKKKPFEATIPTAGAVGSIDVLAKVTLKVKKPGKKAKKIKKKIKHTVAIC
jgi:hypothetical protein